MKDLWKLPRGERNSLMVRRKQFEKRIQETKTNIQQATNMLDFNNHQLNCLQKELEKIPTLDTL